MSQENVEIVRAFFEAVRRGDFREAVTHLAPDVVYRVGQEGPAHGPDAVRAIWERWESEWETVEMTHEHFIDAGEQVVVVTREEARGRGSGIEIVGYFFNVFTLRDRKIVHKVEFTERAKALEAAGLAD